VSGKQARKWAKARPRHRESYIQRVIGQRELSGHLYYSYYRDTRTYIDLTILSTAKAILDAARDPYQATIFVDGLGRPERHRFSAGLRKLRVRVNKVRGVKDQSEEFIRLADAVAGFVRDALQGDPAMQALFEQAKRNGFLKEV
jgi:hypothetical protein